MSRNRRAKPCPGRVGRWWLPASLAALALVAAGCGGDGPLGTASVSNGSSDGEERGEPVDVVDAGDTYTFELPEEPAPYGLSIPAGSITTVSISADPDNSAQVNVSTAEGLVNLSAEPGGTALTEPAIITAVEAGVDTQLLVSGTPGDIISLVVATTLQPDGGDQGDAPEIITGAVALGEDHRGLLGGADGTDYYAIDASAGDVISLEVSVEAAESGSVSAALEYNGERRASVSVAAGGVESARQVLSAAEGGTWYLAVTGQGTYHAVADAAPQPDGGGEGDAGASAAEATAVTAGTFPGLLGGDDDGDFFSFDLPDGGLATLAMSVSPTSGGAVNARMLVNGEERGRIAAQPGGTSDTLDLRFPAGVGGTAIIEVWAGEADYEMTLTTGVQSDGGAEGDAGADAGSAREIGPGTFSGGMSRYDDSDFYSVTSAAGGTATVTISSAADAERRVNWRLLVNGTEVDREASDPGGSSTLEIPLDAGTELVIELWDMIGIYELTIEGTAFPAEAGA